MAQSGFDRWLANFCLWVLPCGYVVSAVPKAAFNIVDEFPHDDSCFTEGLFVNGSDNHVFESCGLYGKSYLKRYHLRTGNVLQRTTIAPQLFSEGLAMLGGSMYMLTYQSHKVQEFDARTFHLQHEHPFPFGEGWGLTTDGCDLLATTGSSYIYRLRARGVTNLELVTKVQVRHRGDPVSMLNELEYVTPKVWVNQWLTNWLWRVDPQTGECETFLDIRGLHVWRGDATPNGIAYSASLGSNRLIVTGKLWPKMFSLQMHTMDLCGPIVSELAQQQCQQAPVSACWQGMPSKQEPTNSSSVSSVSASTQEPIGNVPPPNEFSTADPPPHTQSFSTTFVVVSTTAAAVFAALACAVPCLLRRRRHDLPSAPPQKQTQGARALGQMIPGPE